MVDFTSPIFCGHGRRSCIILKNLSGEGVELRVAEDILATTRETDGFTLLSILSSGGLPLTKLENGLFLKGGDSAGESGKLV